MKSSFDINDQILSLFLRILHLFDTLHPTNVLAKLTWLQFSNFFTCIYIRRTQCPSYCAWQSVSVLWREHQMWHILQMSLSSLVIWCSCMVAGCRVCSIPSFVVQALSYCVIKHVTSGPVIIHLLSAAGSPVTTNAPPSALTNPFAFSRAW